RASGGGGDRRPVDPRPDRGGLEPPDRRPGQCADPAALRPGPVRRPGAGGPGRRLSRAGSAAFPPACTSRGRAARIPGSVRYSLRCAAMKADIHPEYREVVFHDVTSDFKFLTRSTLAATAKESVKWEDGNEYPLVKIEISSASHPFYTGKHKVVDTSGRIDKFQRRYAR